MKKETLRIVLLCDNVIRELASLQLLKTELEKELSAEVHIVGSIAEVQRTYMALYSIQPHVVCISQIMEKDCREIAAYVKESGAFLCVLPAEITPARVVESIIVSPTLKYNHLVDCLFLPGKRMYEYFSRTDIARKKLKITGSPKIDVMVHAKKISRRVFLRKHHLPLNKQTIFLFTSFPRTSLDYFQSDKCFADNMKLMKRIHTAIRDTHQAYLKKLGTICQAFPNTSVVLKPHPLEDLSVYSDLLNVHKNFFIVTKASVTECINAMDVAVHWNSTVCTEFWLHHIPTLQFTPLKKHDWLLSDFSPGNPVFHNVKQLNHAIKAQLTKRHPLPQEYLRYQRHYFKENFYKVDGKSAKRIASLLAKILPKRLTTPIYDQRHAALTHLFFMIEKIIGVTFSRRLASLVTRHYNWQYAVDNYLP